MNEQYHPTAERLEAFVEGLLQPGDRVVVESHLVGCPRCQSEVEDWRALFTALSSLQPLEPSVGFADRVMVHVRIAPRAAWQEWTERATALVARITPRTNFGWTLAAAMLALPILLGGGLVAWLLSKDYITPQTLWAYGRDAVVEGLQGVGATALTWIIQTDVVAWLLGQSRTFLETAGPAGVGALAASAAGATALSAWVLYRNLFRASSQGSHYGTYSF